jgi:hypothetical protein
MSVTLSPACSAEAAKMKGSIARVGSVGPQVAEITKCTARLLLWAAAISHQPATAYRRPLGGTPVFDRGSLLYRGHPILIFRKAG